MIQLSKSFNYTLIPVGRAIFQIKDAMYNQRDQLVVVHLTTKDGMPHTEKFFFRYKDGNFNKAGLDAFTAFARAVMGDANLEHIDTDALAGKYVSANVIHKKKPNKNDPNRTVTLVSLKSFAKATSWND